MGILCQDFLRIFCIYLSGLKFFNGFNHFRWKKKKEYKYWNRQVMALPVPRVELLHWWFRTFSKCLAFFSSSRIIYKGSVKISRVLHHTHVLISSMYPIMELLSSSVSYQSTEELIQEKLFELGPANHYYPINYPPPLGFSSQLES